MRFWCRVGFVVLVAVLIVVAIQVRRHPLQSTHSQSVVSATVVATATSATSTYTVHGIYIGLLDATDGYDRTYKYLLVAQGTGIARIDLRPIYGMNYTDITDRLGLTPGEQIVVTGQFKDGSFVVSQVEPRA